MILIDIVHYPPFHGLVKKRLLEPGRDYGFADLFKTTSNLYVARSLIFKGLMSYFSVIIFYSEISWRRKPLKIRLLLD